MEHSSFPSQGHRRAQSHQSHGKTSGPGSACWAGSLEAPGFGHGLSLCPAQLPKFQPLHPCSGLSPSRPSGADVGAGRKHLRAPSPQHCPFLCQLLPGTAHPAPCLLLGSHFCPASPAKHRYFHGNLPEIRSNASTGVSKPPSPLCFVFQAQLVPLSAYR